MWWDFTTQECRKYGSHVFVIDLVNNDPQVLPNITLGYDIRDTCINENIALDESVDLVLSSGRLEPENCLEQI